MTEASKEQPRRWHRRPQAAKHVQEKHNQPLAETTLATMATRGGGPPFHKVGSVVLYAEDDLDAWAIERLGRAVRSTSELRQPEASAA
jgi:hypothetical protein